MDILRTVAQAAQGLWAYITKDSTAFLTFFVAIFTLLIAVFTLFVARYTRQVANMTYLAGLGNRAELKLKDNPTRRSTTGGTICVEVYNKGKAAAKYTEVSIVSLTPCVQGVAASWRLFLDKQPDEMTTVRINPGRAAKWRLAYYRVPPTGLGDSNLWLDLPDSAKTNAAMKPSEERTLLKRGQVYKCVIQASASNADPVTQVVILQWCQDGSLEMGTLHEPKTAWGKLAAFLRRKPVTLPPKNTGGSPNAPSQEG